MMLNEMQVVSASSSKTGASMNAATGDRRKRNANGNNTANAATLIAV
jgi:hypothetical protein